MSFSPDFVIVGGGTAGCVLASRLTEDPSVKVLVLEIGPRYRGLPIHVPAALGELYARGAYHWGYRSQAEPHAGGQQLPYKLGRLLGGSSAINGLVWARGNRLDFDDWAAAGCPGWSYDDVAPVFHRIEAFHDKSDEQMGKRGPIPVMRGCPDKSPLNMAFLLAAKQAGYAFNSNHNGRVQEGFCAIQRNTRNGRRGDVYQGYLKPALKRPNLKIITQACVERILVRNGMAQGVKYRVEGELRQVAASREIILTAGSLASPQLLELSGIGDAQILTRSNIEVVHDLPGVGKNLHTHPTVNLSYECSRPVSLYAYTRPPGKWLAGIKWLLRRNGPAATNHFEAGAFLKSSPDLDRPDLELTFLPLALNSMTESYKGHGFQIYAELIGCNSRGFTHIQSPHIADQPAFQFNYLQEDRDLVACRAGVQIIRDLVSQPAFDGYRGRELSPGMAVNGDAEIDNWLRHTIGVSHHLVGSCRMGPASDPDAVVGPDLKLHGIKGLRVADASIMPKVTSANTHAATIMIAERAIDFITRQDL